MNIDPAMEGTDRGGKGVEISSLQTENIHVSVLHKAGGVLVGAVTQFQRLLLKSLCSENLETSSESPRKHLVTSVFLNCVCVWEAGATASSWLFNVAHEPPSKMSPDPQSPHLQG